MGDREEGPGIPIPPDAEGNNLGYLDVGGCTPGAFKGPGSDAVELKRPARAARSFSLSLSISAWEPGY